MHLCSFTAGRFHCYIYTCINVWRFMRVCSEIVFSRKSNGNERGHVTTCARPCCSSALFSAHSISFLYIVPKYLSIGHVLERAATTLLCCVDAAPIAYVTHENYSSCRTRNFVLLRLSRGPGNSIEKLEFVDSSTLKNKKCETNFFIYFLYKFLFCIVKIGGNSRSFLDFIV